MQLVPGTMTDFAAFYTRHKGRLHVTIDEAEEYLKHWQIWRLDDPQPVAVFLVKDGHGHVAGYGRSKVGLKRLKKAMRYLDICKTTVSEEFSGGHALAKRLGFRVDHIEGKVTHYALSDN